ncbi:MAG TPA: hypothetical protein VGF45_16185 [Polyangia bacterium]
MNRTWTAVLATAWIGTSFGMIACGGSGNGTRADGGGRGQTEAGQSGDGSGHGGARGAGGTPGFADANGAGVDANADATTADGTSDADGNNDLGGFESGRDADAGEDGNDAGPDLPGSIPRGSDGGLPHPTMSFFVTSEGSRTGNLGGLAAADDNCQHFGASGGLGAKTWKAYLSTTTENAVDRIGTGPWFNFKGEMIAENLDQLHEVGGLKNNLTQQTALTNTGQIVSGRSLMLPGFGNQHDILTGSLRNGRVKPNAHCDNWTSTTGLSGVGHVDRMGEQADPVAAASWNDAHEGQCSATRLGGGAGRIYCFAID